MGKEWMALLQRQNQLEKVIKTNQAAEQLCRDSPSFAGDILSVQK